MSGNHNEAYEPQNFMHVHSLGNSCAGNFFLQFLSYLPLIRLVARLSSLQRQKRQCHQCHRVLRATQKRLRSGGSQRLSQVLDRWRPLGRDTSGLLLQNTDFGGENCETTTTLSSLWYRWACHPRVETERQQRQQQRVQQWGLGRFLEAGANNDVVYKNLNGSGIAIYCQPHIGVFPGRPSQLFTRSEGGVGAAGSVLRGAGGEKENRGMRNLDGMVGSFL